MMTHPTGAWMTMTQLVKVAGMAAVPAVAWDLKVPEVVTAGAIAGMQAEPVQHLGSRAAAPAVVRVAVAASVGAGVKEAVGVRVALGVVDREALEVVEGVGVLVEPWERLADGLAVTEGVGELVKSEGHSQPRTTWPLASLT